MSVEGIQLACAKLGGVVSTVPVPGMKRVRERTKESLLKGGQRGRKGGFRRPCAAYTNANLTECKTIISLRSNI